MIFWLLLLLLVPMVPMVDAHMGIILSGTCTTLIKNNMTTICPSYEDIVTVFPDTSEPRMSGAFTYEDGWYHREYPPIQKHFKYYDHLNKDALWIDPPGDVIEKMPRIFITATDFEYKIKDNNMINSTKLKTGQGRYVSSTCTYAIIKSDNWFFLLGDTMRYLKSGCDPEMTYFDEIKIRKWEAVRHDITTSAKYKLEQWQKQAIEDCGTRVCIPK